MLQQNQTTHRRAKSAALLKSLINPPSPTKAAGSSTQPSTGHECNSKPFNVNGASQLSKHPVPTRTVESSVLSEMHGNQSPKKDSRRPKSAAISAIISGKSEQDSQVSTTARIHDKENASPSENPGQELYTPIWAQFASQPILDDLTAQNQRPDMKDIPHNTNPRMNPKISHPTEKPGPAKANSRVMNAVAMFNNKEKKATGEQKLNSKDFDAAFEAVLVSRNIPEKMRQNMRNLDSSIKADFIKHNSFELPITPAKTNSNKPSFWPTGRSKSRGRDESKIDSPVGESEEKQGSPYKRSRSRNRAFTFGKSDKSPTKRARSNSRPRSIMSFKNFSSSSINSLANDGSKDSNEQPVSAIPEEFVQYIRENAIPETVEVGRLHKLRLLLRNEAVAWVDRFISKGGMTELLGLLNRIMQVEWREEHEDLLLHEVLLCLKGLCTTEKALEKLEEVAPTLFPDLLRMLFDEERKGPSEFNTRGIIMNLLFTHLSSTEHQKRIERTQEILKYIADPSPPENEKPIGFILDMHQKRPYQAWCREITNVTREVFWIFLHQLNVVPVITLPDSLNGCPYTERHFPRERPPVPAAPYVGGVEWEATNYIATHLDLMNALIASFETRSERNTLRAELAASGMEKLMGGSLRLCKEKFYGAVHDGLQTWVCAAMEDDWDMTIVRMGVPKEVASPSKSPSKSPKKEALSPPPKLELPKLQVDLGVVKGGRDDMWI